MAEGRVAGCPDLTMDLGHPLVNRVVNGFVRVAGVGVLHAATQDAAKMMFQEETNSQILENMVQHSGKEALQWGLVAGVYSGVTYAMQEVRGTHDWKNAVLGGALAGAALSLTDQQTRRHDRIVQGVITGAALATAADFLRNITCK